MQSYRLPTIWTNLLIREYLSFKDYLVHRKPIDIVGVVTVQWSHNLFSYNSFVKTLLSTKALPIVK